MSTVQPISRLRDLRYQGNYAAIEESVTNDPVAAEYASVVNTICPTIRTFWDAWYEALPDAPVVLRPYVDDILDTRGNGVVSVRRSLLCLDWIVRVYAPTWLEHVPATCKLAASMRSLPRIDAMEVLESANVQNLCQDVWVAMWDNTVDATPESFELASELASRAGADAATMAAWRLIDECATAGEAEAAIFRARDAADRALALLISRHFGAIGTTLQTVQTDTLCLLRELIASR